MPTIRQALKSQLFNARVVGIAGWLLVVLAWLFDDSQYAKPLGIIGFCVFFLSVVYSLYLVRCPKCRTALGQAFNGTGKLDYCQGCGVSLDSHV